MDIQYINTTTLAYPVLLPDLCRAFPHISFPATGPDAATLAGLGYAEVTPVEPPAVAENQTVVEGAPELSDGVWRQTWVVGEMTAEAYAAKVASEKVAACVRIEAKRQEVLAEGISVTWPDGVTSRVQTRNEADWRNVQGVASTGLAMLTQGETDDLYFRDANDQNHTLTPTQAVGWGKEVFLKASAIAKIAQDTKDAINADTVATVSGIAAIEAAVVWPG